MRTALEDDEDDEENKGREGLIDENRVEQDAEDGKAEHVRDTQTGGGLVAQQQTPNQATPQGAPSDPSGGYYGYNPNMQQQGSTLVAEQPKGPPPSPGAAARAAAAAATPAVAEDEGVPELF